MRGAGSRVLAGVYGTHWSPDERSARPRAWFRQACRRGAARPTAPPSPRGVREIRRAVGSRDPVPARRRLGFTDHTVATVRYVVIGAGGLGNAADPLRVRSDAGRAPRTGGAPTRNPCSQQPTPTAISTSSSSVASPSPPSHSKQRSPRRRPAGLWCAFLPVGGDPRQRTRDRALLLTRVVRPGDSRP